MRDSAPASLWARHLPLLIALHCTVLLNFSRGWDFTYLESFSHLSSAWNVKLIARCENRQRVKPYYGFWPRNTGSFCGRTWSVLVVQILGVYEAESMGWKFVCLFTDIWVWTRTVSGVHIWHLWVLLRWFHADYCLLEKKIWWKFFPTYTIDSFEFCVHSEWADLVAYR